MNLRTPLLTALIYLPALSGISPSQTPAPPAWSFLEDADQDGMTDVNEILLGLDPLNPADGLSDLDGDGLSLAWEFVIGTHASLADTDADGWSDSEEYLTHGTDPRDWLSFPVTSSSPSAIPPVAAPLPAPAAATPPPPPPPPPSLSNGDFSVQNFSWRSGQTYKDYQGGGFDWGQGTVSGWSAYVGTTVEVWKSGTETFVELDGTSSSHGIKQDIANVVPGHYALVWKQCGRTNNLAEDNAYRVRIYYTPVAGAAPITISESAEYKAIDKTMWTDNAHSFQLNAAQIAAAANGKITVAFIPTGSLNTYGTLIDKVTLLSTEIKEVRFAGSTASNYHELKSDDGSIIYNAPHWVDVDGDGTATTSVSSGEKNYPISFTRNTKPKVGGEFKIVGLPSGQALKIKASSDQGLQIPEISVTPAASGAITLPLTTVSNNLINSIQFHNADDNTAFKIDWEISIGNGRWIVLGSTKHTVYITMADPITTATVLMRETLFSIGCRNAKGLGTGTQAIVDAIYSDFKSDKNVQKVKQSSGTLDGVAMTFHGNPNTAGSTTSDLLSSGDGACGAWAKLFIDVLRSQGIDTQMIGYYAPLSFSINSFDSDFAARFPSSKTPPIKNLFPVIFVKSWALAGDRFAPTDNKGIESQGNTDPIAYFRNHAVVEYGGKIYDPSFGSDVFNSHQEWENAALDGFGVFTSSLFPNGSEIWFEKADPKNSIETIRRPLSY
jgi:hypothetical protein